MFQKFAVGVFAIIVQPVNATEQTAPLPPILNYHPVCEPKVIKEQTQTRFYIIIKKVILNVPQKRRSVSCKPCSKKPQPPVLTL